ncbi:MAG: MSHA biogenesis protein MshE, partial [Candidatus Omnitrophica bacterium]|nr:MSHA biogenesis protein MshE [Candidatus Omnitrophota bacterium]
MSTVGVTKRLGELLMDKGLISAGQLEHALQEQRTSGEFLGAILVRRKWVKEGDLLSTLGEQMGIPYVRLAEQAV